MMDELQWPQTRVRLANPADRPAIFQQCKMLSQENGIVPMKDELVLREIDNALARNHALLAVVGDEGRVEGSICLRLAHYWYNDDFWWLEDRWCYVEPEYRAGPNSKDLLEFANWWRQQLDIPLMMGILSSQRTEAKLRLYRRIFGPLTGGFWLVGARTGETENV